MAHLTYKKFLSKFSRVAGNFVITRQGKIRCYEDNGRTVFCPITKVADIGNPREGRFSRYYKGPKLDDAKWDGWMIGLTYTCRQDIIGAADNNLGRRFPNTLTVNRVAKVREDLLRIIEKKRGKK